MNLAIIDVGTLKVKFEIRNEKGEVLYKDKKLTVLGRDLPKNKGRIIEKGIHDTIAALQTYGAVMREHKVDRYRAVATEAIRKATNAQEVLERIKKETNIELEILTHDAEGRVLFHELSRSFPGKVITVADIGGGSVQVAIGKDDDLQYLHLFRTGAYFMQELFSETHLPTAKEYAAATAYVQKEFRPLTENPPQIDELIYGSSSIIDFMQAMGMPLHATQYGYLHPFRVMRNDLEKLYKKIISLSFEDRMLLYPAEPYFMWGADRALINIFELMRIFDMDSIIPTNQNISSGLFAELAR
jgi:exopolyphosphatase / guanosine-5'-triphosphate,3'-diphosphate pyrophosphatase